MKKVIVLMLLLLLAAGGRAWAQGYPKAEIGGGFALERSGGVNFPGWHVTAAGNLNQSVGIAGEVAGLYKNIDTEFGTVNTSTYLFMVGPRLGLRFGTGTGFFHVLFGGMNSRVGVQGVSASATYFAMSVGGGLDVNVGKSVAIRVAQVDRLGARVEGMWGYDFRYMAGVVFKLGAR
jgi:hypothetical protein